MAPSSPSSAPELRQKVAQTYEYMWDEAYNGNRAPILIANHFNKWNGDSFNPPAKDFMQDKCGQPDTYCTTYSGRHRLDGDPGSGRHRRLSRPAGGRHRTDA